MKQKYKIIKDNSNNTLIIQEYIEYEEQIPYLLCEEKYELKYIKNQAKKNIKYLIRILRTDNMYPPNTHAIKIAKALLSIINSNNRQSIDISFDDKEINYNENKKQTSKKDTDNINKNIEINMIKNNHIDPIDIDIDDLLENELSEREEYKLENTIEPKTEISRTKSNMPQE